MYKMVDSKYLEIHVGAIIKNPDILRLVLDHLKTKKMFKHAIKKLLHVVKYVPDQYKI